MFLMVVVSDVEFKSKQVCPLATKSSPGTWIRFEFDDALPRVINFKFSLHLNLAFHGLLRRKMIILQILTTSLIHLF